MIFFLSQSVKQLLVALFFLLIVASNVGKVDAQPFGHPLYPAGLPTGAVAQGTLLQPLPMNGYFQPVKLIMPEGCVVSFATGDTFVSPQPASTLVALLVGNVYRFQVSEIPYNAGAEIYPTLEMVGRLFPPPGKESEFPVEVEITQEDLELAISGRLVTKVVYLEDPLRALPTQGTEKSSLAIDAKAKDNPYNLAAASGRPMAILRVGNRQPSAQENESTFFFGSPAWQAIVDASEQVTGQITGQVVGLQEKIR